MASRHPAPILTDAVPTVFATRRRFGQGAYTHVSRDREGRQFLCAISGSVADGQVIRHVDGGWLRLHLLGSED